LNTGDPQSIHITGDYTQSAAGFMDIDLASLNSFGQVNVGGNLNRDGTLNLTLESGFTAALGSSFDIINWVGTRTPTDFSVFNNVIFDGGETFQELVNGKEIDLVVVTATSAAPEPSTLAMLLCATLMGAGIAWRISRRRRA